MSIKIKRGEPRLFTVGAQRRTFRNAVEEFRQNSLYLGTRHSQPSPQYRNFRYPVLAFSALMNFRKSRSFKRAL
jgi:hypothetical protein